MKQKKLEQGKKIVCDCKTTDLLKQLGKVTPSLSAHIYNQYVIYCWKHEQDVTRDIKNAIPIS